MSGMVWVYWIAAYLLGAIPVGWLITWFVKHEDIRYKASGRTGMSNVIRNAGTGWGILTGILDIFKGFAATFFAPRMLSEAKPWVLAIGGILSVLGHMYSIFLIEKRRNGKYYLRGGAGGMTSVGAGIGLWWPYVLIAGLPCLVIYLFIGYASVATAAFNIFAAVGFAIAAAMGKISWWYVLYTIGAGILVAISLRPNFKRLRRGDERKTSLRIRWRKEDRK